MPDQNTSFTTADLNSELAMEFYASLFFDPERPESKCILHILKQYVQNGFRATPKEFRQFIDSSTAIRNVKPTTIRNVLNYYTALCWHQCPASSENWRTHLGWNSRLPPSVVRGLRLFCQNYLTFFPAP